MESLKSQYGQLLGSGKNWHIANVRDIPLFALPRFTLTTSYSIENDLLDDIGQNNIEGCSGDEVGG